ncbi:MAG: hypothetical protein GC171_13915 [Terrimonas sp.]|nr:hypothetical protein [Terrimonas sp.]
MNKWILGLNVLLLAAVGFLFYKVYDGPEKGVKKGSKTAKTNTPADFAPVKIGYFEMDSVEENFELFKEVLKEMNKKQDEKVNELTRLQKILQQKYEDFKMKAPGMNQAQGEAAQKELQDIDNRIKATKDNMEQRSSEYFMEKQQKILNMIREFFKQYNEEKGYTYIFASEPGLMYLKDTVYNVTGDLLKGLNEMYRSEKKDKK